MDAVIFRKVWSKLLNCAFSWLNVKFSARQLLHCFKKFSCVLRISFCRLITSSPIDSLLGQRQITRRWALSRLRITAEMILFAISFSSRASFNASICISSLSLVISPPKLYRCFHHLDFVFPNRFSSLYPASPPNGHPPARYTSGHLSALVYCLSSGQV